jgi:NAD(P)-dependent dehydrogenase (short-subunit alcohol dehydrogenase family)
MSLYILTNLKNMSESEGKNPTPKAAYERARRAEETARQVQAELEELKSMMSQLLQHMQQHAAPPSNIQANALRPGQFIHQPITEDTEEVICPVCGTREIRKIPTKITVKEIVPDNYIPAPRSISEVIQLFESMRLPDGRTVFESPKFWEYIEQISAKYGPGKRK